MTTTLDKKSNTPTSLTLAERLKAALDAKNSVKPQTPSSTSASCSAALVLDDSGSMFESMPNGRERKVDALRRIAEDVLKSRPNLAVFAFSTTPRRIASLDELGEGGNTNIGAAIRLARQTSDHIIIVTDGEPTDGNAALSEVRGLGFDIFYVGPPPRPNFLDRLAAAARAGSTAQTATLHKDAPQLTRRIVALLGA